jgi:ubiquinone/menaquinone biosynthesis C-methylase UbiE
MSENKSVEEIRNVAVDHHHSVVEVFEEYYRSMSRDRFSNAFAYGRHKVDVALDAELRRLKPGAPILDIGCGTGEYVKKFSAMGFKLSGMEPAVSMREAAQKNNPKLKILDGVATALPFKDESFDLVFAIEVFRYLHIEDFRQSMAEMLRVLKPGGRMFFSMVNKYALDGFYALQRVRQLVNRSTADTKHPHCEFFTPASLKAEMNRAGINEVEVFGRMLASLRFAYKVPLLGGLLAPRLDKLDDLIHRFDSATPFAGHLLAIGSKR